MELREKVIKGFECCLPMTTKDGQADCKNCPYDRPITLEGGVCECIHELMIDALELVKKQDAGKVNITITQSDGWKEGNCPFCGMKVDNFYNWTFCGTCGRELIWND